MRWRFSTLEIILLLLVVAGSGMAYAWVVYGGGGLIGATYALFMCMPILAFERHIIFRRLYRRIHDAGVSSLVPRRLLHIRQRRICSRRAAFARRRRHA